ncbi:5-formyltetrahydrofolate cyclo-ligase-like isoform X2 [Uloborus diversus]|nr:5-formyltetrahydrofolate cyclo-ligase-like isoform X2 [Uloborus diversus]XP_054718434.1 5-formyltetrahydrofolate cyclo-ligase-like isoform X2 [Uloborus diversus]
MSLRVAKNALRQTLKDTLRNMPPEERQMQSDVVLKKLFQNKKYLESKRISVYLSRDIEVDTKGVLLNLFKSGKECFIPKYCSKSTQMDMVKLNSLEDFDKLPLTSWKIKQPAELDNSYENALCTGGLDLIIVPGIGFTKLGHRIGNGKGYYDTYLKECEEKLGKKVPTVALAFREQMVPSIPVDDHDVPIDEVIFPD